MTRSNILTPERRAEINRLVEHREHLSDISSLYSWTAQQQAIRDLLVIIDSMEPKP